MNYLAFLKLIKNDEFLAKLITHKSQTKTQNQAFNKYNYIIF